MTGNENGSQQNGKNGLMPVSTDALVLADFVLAKPGQRILDLGTGAGIIALTLAGRQNVELVGIDNNIEAIEEARKRLERDKGLLAGSCHFEPGDLRNEEYIRELGAFHQVVCNPPYYKLGNGRLPPQPGQATARHETTCTLEDVIRAAAWALEGDGAFSFIQIPERLLEALELLQTHGFSANSVQPVYTRRRRDAELILVRAVSGANNALRFMTPRQLRALTGNS